MNHAIWGDVGSYGLSGAPALWRLRSSRLNPIRVFVGSFRIDSSARSRHRQTWPQDGSHDKSGKGFPVGSLLEHHGKLSTELSWPQRSYLSAIKAVFVPPTRVNAATIATHQHSKFTMLLSRLPRSSSPAFRRIPHIRTAVKWAPAQDLWDDPRGPLGIDKPSPPLAPLTADSPQWLRDLHNNGVSC